MEKLKSDWQSTLITTTFRVKLINDQPAVCASPRGERYYTEICGLGWRFAMVYSSYSQSITLEYDPHFAHPGLGVQRVTATLRSEEMKDGQHLLREMRPADTSKRTPLVTWPTSSFVNHRILIFEVGLREPIDIPQPIGLAPSIRHALSESTRSGTFVDTRFFVYSKRSSSGRVYHPLPVYANNPLLKEKSEYMKTLLSHEGFSDSETGDIHTGFPANGEPFTDAYDYESDSDLEDEEDTDAILAADRKLIGTASPRTEEHSLVLRSRPTHESQSDAQGEKRGRTVHIKDMAYRTWQSLIFYLYTGDVAFLPLSSDPSQSREVVAEQYLADHPHDPPPCSPKSMYRLAEKLGLEELENLSFRAIRAGLSEANILEEVFSRFTSRYPVLQDMEVDMLCKEYYTSPAVAGAFSQMMQPVAGGDLPHSASVLTSIFEKLAKRGT